MLNTEDKYYTPTIEEFHVGFEYEALVDYYGDKYEAFMIEDTSDLIQRMETYDSQDMDFIRVKYLDREDIESLGFEFKEEHRFSKIYSKHNEAIEIREDGEVRIGLINYGINDCVDKITIWFRGTIKNKSELKKVLKMIGYDNK
jgi:hypothetical protein